MPVKLIEFTRGVYLTIKLVSTPPPSVFLEKVGCPASCLNSDLALLKRYNRDKYAYKLINIRQGKTFFNLQLVLSTLIHKSNSNRIDSKRFFAIKLHLTRKKQARNAKNDAKSTKTRGFYRTVRKLKFLFKNESDMPVKLIEHTRGVYLTIKLVCTPPPSVFLEKVGCPASCLNSDLTLLKRYNRDKYAYKLINI